MPRLAPHLGPGQIPPDQQIASVTADGGFDTRKCHNAIAARGAAAIIPPRKKAKPWKPDTPGAIARNEALRASKRFGRKIWRRWNAHVPLSEATLHYPLATSIQGLTQVGLLPNWTAILTTSPVSFWAGRKAEEPTRRRQRMQPLLPLARTIDRANELIGKSVMWLILLAVLVSAANAAIRKLFNMSSNSWLELQWYLFGAAFMLASAYTLKQNEHIRIDIFYGTRTRMTQHWIDLFGHVLFTLPFVVLMAWMLIPYTWNAYSIGQISTNAGGLIIWPARAVLAVGFILLSFQAVSEIIKKIAVMRGEMEDPTPFISAHEAAELEGAALAAEVARLAAEEEDRIAKGGLR
jgi:TRAP-type mannitol/chloroaromatic compound transport system permease small subunit